MTSTLDGDIGPKGDRGLNGLNGDKGSIGLNGHPG